MIPKWIGAALALALTAAFWTPWALVAAVVGVLVFFPNEYAVHRWVYHATPPDQAPSRLAKSHIEHHLEPRGLDRIFNDPRVSVTLGLVYVLLAWLATRDWGIAGGFASGAFFALLYYEYVHFTAHRPGIVPWMPWGRRLKKMHLWHHYKNEHYWFGVTTQGLDKLFGSYRDPDDVEKSPTVKTLVPPERLAEYMES